MSILRGIMEKTADLDEYDVHRFGYERALERAELRELIFSIEPYPTPFVMNDAYKRYNEVWDTSRIR